MIKTLCIVLVLVLSVLLVPVWVQVGLFVCGVIVSKYRLAYVVPALFADAWYAPVRDSALSHNKMTILILSMILVSLFFMRNTRIQ